jgi:phosphoribosylformylglycinamidine synthase I
MGQANSQPTIAIVIFPGTNCELDAQHAVSIVGANTKMMWHSDTDLSGIDAVIVPGGFAHGDYLRTGAIARFSPIMKSVEDFAAKGGPVLGICNGFQVLCEAKLLPGALRKNAGMKFLCKEVELEVVSTNSPLTKQLKVGDKRTIPINHFEGNYTCSKETYEQLVANDQIVLRYTNNPNGSFGDIAGVCNEARNVVGLMPHPERACEEILGSIDGKEMIASFVKSAIDSKQLTNA